jgi:hypothetical protein
VGGHVRREFALLAPCEGWRRSVVDGFHRLYHEAGEAGGTEKLLFTFNPRGWLRKLR